VKKLFILSASLISTLFISGFIDIVVAQKSGIDSCQNELKQIELANSRIALLSKGKILTNAARMLRDEVYKRTRVEIELDSVKSQVIAPLIKIGTTNDLQRYSIHVPKGLDGG